MPDFYAAAEKTVESLNAFVRKHALVGAIKADHLCYKCDSTTSFEARRAALEPLSSYVHQSYISGRRIAYLRFKKGVGSQVGMINFLELSDQKPDQSQGDGFDHVEIYPLIGTYDELVAKLERAGERVIKVERPHHTTHDIKLDNGFIIRLCQEPLVEKIKREEMV